MDKGWEALNNDDIQTGISYFNKAAKDGDAEAQCLLGLFYNTGVYLKKDYQKAFYWYEQAAKQNIPKAQAQIGYMYEMGYGVSKDSPKAIFWLEKAAKQNDVHAQYLLGSIYLIKNNESKARVWLVKASQNGNKDAIKLLEDKEKQKKANK